MLHSSSWAGKPETGTQVLAGTGLAAESLAKAFEQSRLGSQKQAWTGQGTSLTLALSIK